MARRGELWLTQGRLIRFDNGWGSTMSKLEHLVTGLCWCHKHHYVCDRCHVDCTAGTRDGPATRDVRGVTRCRECYEELNRARAALSPWSEDELRTIRVALSQIADDGDPEAVLATDRKIATNILCRLERR